MSRYTLETHPAIALLVDFAAQNSGIDPRNYGVGTGQSYGRGQWREAWSSYRSEARSISKDWERFKEAFQVAAAEGVTDVQVIDASRRAFSGRLEWHPKQHTPASVQAHEAAAEGSWEYTTGQYFCTEYRKAAAAVLEYAVREARRARPPQLGQCSTIAEVKALNERNGGCWFQPAEMRFFGTRIESGVIAGQYFVSSEQPPHGPRQYSVRSFDEKGSVDTVGEFCGYDTKAAAMAALREHIRDTQAQTVAA